MTKQTELAPQRLNVDGTNTIRNAKGRKGNPPGLTQRIGSQKNCTSLIAYCAVGVKPYKGGEGIGMPKEPILIRAGYNGRSIWWIPGSPKPDPRAIDAKEAWINEQMNRKRKSEPRLVRTEDGWTEDGVLVREKYPIWSPPI